MRNVIGILVDCLGDLSDTSKQQLATIIRRELEKDMQDSGLSKNVYPTTIEMNLANENRKLEAVKRFKNRTGLSLMESKRAIEQDSRFIGTQPVRY